MKTFSASLLSSYANRVSTITSCVKIIRLDGVTYRFTSLDKNLIIDGETYLSSYSFNPTAYTSALGLQIENMEIEGAVDSLNIDDFDIFKNLFYGSQVWFFSVDYRNLSAGKDKILYGTVGEIELTDKMFKFEVRGMSKRYDNLYASYYGKICRARLGDSRCGIDISSYILNGTVNNSNSNTFISTNYIKLDMKILNTYAQTRIFDVLFYNSADELVTVKTVSMIVPYNCVCQDGSGIGGPIDKIIDNSVLTWACLNPIGTTYYISGIIFEFNKKENISKIIIKDDPTYNSGNIITQVDISSSVNYYTWKSEASILTASYRAGDTVTIPLSYILVTDGTNKFRFVSNDIKNANKENNYFQYGNITWLTGLNKGLQTEIIQADSSGNVELALPTVYDIQSGDTFNMTPGCNHLLVGNDGTVATGHCKTKYNNVLNFRGEAYLPNEDVILSGYIAIQKAREAEEEGKVLLEPIDE